jgi:hypothetical protein
MLSHALGDSLKAACYFWGRKLGSWQQGLGERLDDVDARGEDTDETRGKTENTAHSYDMQQGGLEEVQTSLVQSSCYSSRWDLRREQNKWADRHKKWKKAGEYYFI